MTDDSEQERWSDEDTLDLCIKILQYRRWGEEQMDEPDQHRLERLDAHIENLRRIRGGEGERCEKCGSDDINTRHEEAGPFRRSHRCQDTPEEHLHRTCRNCGWGWCEPALSSDDGEEGPEGYADIGEYAEYLVKCWHREEMTTDQVVHNLAAYVDAELGLDADAAPDTEGREEERLRGVADYPDDYTCPSCGKPLGEYHLCDAPGVVGGSKHSDARPEEAGGEDVIDWAHELERLAGKLRDAGPGLVCVHRGEDEPVNPQIGASALAQTLEDAANRLRRPPEGAGEAKRKIVVRLNRLVKLAQRVGGPAMEEIMRCTGGIRSQLYYLRTGREGRDDG